MKSDKQIGGEGGGAFDISNPETCSFDQVNYSKVTRGDSESWIRYFIRTLGAKKSVDVMLAEAEKHELKRNLNATHLTCISIGCIVGSGIFVYSGLVAAKFAGPAVVLTFIIAGFVAGLSALCYSEIASMIPVAGSAYAYTYATMGEFVAWIVGWVLILEYMVGCAAVGVGWSGYLTSFMKDAFNLHLSKEWTTSSVIWKEDTASFELTGAYLNLPALIVITLLSTLLIIGTKESATFTATIVAIKIAVILIFIFGAAPDVDPSNWVPFLPEAVGDHFGHFGIAGLFKGTSMVFFCYTGFDSVSTTALETKNPKRDLPIGIISSLVISTLLYIGVSLVMVGIVDYRILGVAQPIAIAIEAINKRWLGIIVGLGAVVGMTTTMLATMMAQSRIFFSMAKDGLLPKQFGYAHPKFQTPYVSQAIVGILAALISATCPVDVLGEMTGMGTLFGFSLVCIGTMILRVTRPELPRGFVVPFGPYLIPLAGALCSTGLIFTTSMAALARFFGWIGIGIVLYFIYGYRYSKINQPEKWLKRNTKN